MKQTFSIFSSLLILGQVLCLPVISIYLESERDFFAKNYCINRMEPELMCSGSCYILNVTEDLFQGEENDPAPAPNSVNRLPITLTVADLPMAPQDQVLYYQTAADCYLSSYSYLPTFSFFHPPQV